MKTSYKATYFDGKSAVKHEVLVEVTSGAIKITAGNGKFMEWPFGSFKQTQGLFENEDLKFELRKPSPGRFGEALVIKDKTFLEYMFQFLPPKYRSQFETKNKLKRMFYFIPIGTLLAGLVLWVVNFHGLPLLSKVIADKVTPEYEKSVGREAFNQYNKHSVFCGKGIDSDGEENDLTRVLQSMVDTYNLKLKDNPYDFDVYIVKSKQLNAYALPGGYMVFYTGLIEKTKTPEQLAGVLAHEMQHVIRKHSMRHVVRQNLVSFVSMALFGGDMSAISNVAVMFSSLEYSRELETESDEYGASLMEDSNIDINGMAEFFEILQEKEKEIIGDSAGSDYFEYISTHPLSKNRTANIREIASKADYNPKAIYPDLDWESVKMSCTSGAEEDSSD